jgi:hypothetical protein
MNSPQESWRHRRQTARDAVAPAARTLAETKYSYEAYLERTRQACAALMPNVDGPVGQVGRVVG